MVASENVAGSVVPSFQPLVSAWVREIASPVEPRADSDPRRVRTFTTCGDGVDVGVRDPGGAGVIEQHRTLAHRHGLGDLRQGAAARHDSGLISPAPNDGLFTARLAVHSAPWHLG